MPLTLLFVTSMHSSAQFPLRGVIVERLANALREMGHRVEFVKLGVGHPIRYLLARRRVRQAIRALAPDVIHVHFGYCGLAVPATALPLVTTFNGDDLNGTVTGSGRVSWKSRFGVLISHWVAWRSTRCITVSAGLRDRLWLSQVRAKTVRIRDAVDIKLFKPLSRSVARHRLGLSGDDVLVVFPHDATQPTKRLWLAEESVDVLRQWVPRARLWVVNGRPPDEMPWYYAAADAMVVTSLTEGGPTSVKEALACGLPVVSVPVGDVELFGEVGDAIVPTPPQPSDIAIALRDCLTRTESDRRSRLPSALSLPEAVNAICDVYREAITVRDRRWREPT